MTFAEFMQLALYHPKTGYYTTRNNVGKGGDFVTGPTTSPLLGEIMAEAILDLCDNHLPSSIIEFGGAQGYLASDILRQLPWEVTYYIIEKSTRQILSDHPQIKRVRSLQKIPKRARKNPVILGNEFLDALPFHIVLQTKEGLREVYVQQNGSILKEKLGALSDKKIEGYFKKIKEYPREGNRAEVSLAPLQWLQRVRQFCVYPLIILIDYGRHAHELYDVTRPKGTLRCFDHQQLDDNPYERVGEKDITADVNWTAIEKEAERLGLKKILFQSQSRFLLTHGERLLHKRAFTEKERRGLQTLVHPEWMGKAFQVMVLKK